MSTDILLSYIILCRGGGKWDISGRVIYFLYMYVYVCMYMYTCMYIYTYTYMYMYICVHVYTCIHVYVSIYMYMCAYTCMYIHAYIHAHTYIENVDTHTCRHTHIYNSVEHWTYGIYYDQIWTYHWRKYTVGNTWEEIIFLSDLTVLSVLSH